jgi:hypothetical protein
VNFNAGNVYVDNTTPSTRYDCQAL